MIGRPKKYNQEEKMICHKKRNWQREEKKKKKGIHGEVKY
jgi:hypothetical protein